MWRQNLKRHCWASFTSFFVIGGEASPTPGTNSIPLSSLEQSSVGARCCLFSDSFANFARVYVKQRKENEADRRTNGEFAIPGRM